MKYLITLLTILYSTVNFAQFFTDIDAPLPLFSFSVSQFGDIDNDGDLDLFLSGIDDNGSVLGGLYIFDQGNYTLSTTSNLPVVFLGAAEWGDIDNDGDLDILIMGSDASFVDITVVYINNNDGTFSNLNANLDPIEQGSVAFVDYNNDDYLDISITGIGTPDRITKFYTSNAGTSFTELTGVDVPGLNIGKIKWADYNNDGFQDFIIAGFDDNTGGSNDFYTELFTNNGNETFTKSTEVFHKGWLGDIEWEDYNNDGNVDVVISGTGGDGTERFTLLYKNDGDGTFTELNPGFPGVSHSSLEWADFNNDGDKDLFITGVTTTPGDGNNVSTIFINNGNDDFIDIIVENLNTSYFGDADSGDFDNDGLIDLVITGYSGIYESKSAVYLNSPFISVNDNELDKLNIYPNPTKNGIINIQNYLNLSETEILVYNLTGAIVFKIDEVSNTLDLSNLSTGTYILKVKSENNVITKKLIIN